MPRTEFPAKVRTAARERAREAGDLCECGCGGSLTRQHVEYHHDLEAYLDGRPTLANCRAILARCHRRITTVRAPVLAKVQRVIDARDGVQGRSRPMPGGRHDPRKRLIGGGVVSRATGLPLPR